MRSSLTYRAARRNAEKVPEARLARKTALREIRDRDLAQRIATGPVPALTQAEHYAHSRALEADRRAAHKASKARAALAWAILHPKLPSSRALLQAAAHAR